MLYFDDIPFDDEQSYTDDHTSRHALTLHQLNALVKDVIQLGMNRDYWVTVELASVRENRGHCYMELIEKDGHTNTPIAQARAVCWRGAWLHVAPRFRFATGQDLCAGLKVMIKVRASFHEAYGFSWVVSDIDPTYTLGDMARRRQEILKQLKDEGVIDMNKSLRISPFACRIAVISSATAAGYGDFCNQLDSNDFGFRFETHLFGATMQGENVESSIMEALDNINKHIENFDVVVIIRGGGSTADLSGFDTLLLAECVANFPLPIITGIGHERDKSVLDYIACISCKTPTAVAAWLIDNLANTLSGINDAAHRITKAAQERMRAEQMRMQHLRDAIRHGFTIRKECETRHIALLSQRMAHAAATNVSKQQHMLSLISQRLPWLMAAQLGREQHRMAMIEQRCKSVDPQNILSRGYSITMLHSRAVTDMKQLKAGDEVTVRLSKGKVKAVVK